MATALDPIVGNWYRHLDKGQLFTVLGVDESGKVITLQHFDGDIEEIGLVEWRLMELEPAEAPEDWSGPVDNIEHDDEGYSETDMSGSDWSEPLGEGPRPKEEVWQDTQPEDERDEWAEGETDEEVWQEDRMEDTLVASVPSEEEAAEKPPESES